MGTMFFTVKKLPDLTLARYSAAENGSVEEVVRLHAAFLRQLHRKGELFREVYHLIYLYLPDEQPGKRLRFFFGADGMPDGNGPACMEQFMEALPLSEYFHFEKTDPLKDEKYVKAFRFRARLAKQDGYVPSSLMENETRYYVVNPWKSNEKARLYGLFRLMQKLGRPAAFSVTMQAVDLSQSMRNSFQQQIQYIRTIQSQNRGARDENAEQCLRVYEKLFENLRTNPHFRCSISAFAEHPALAKMILDSAASEAVEEGNYRISAEEGTYYPLMPGVEIPEMCREDAPRGMHGWNSLYLLKELVPFAMLPVLYPAEDIEIPKETAPLYEKTGLYLGKDRNGYDVYYPLDKLSRHALLTGMPGSGKTYSMLHISSQLAGPKNRIPVLILEPAKKEYRALARTEDLTDLIVFSPGAAGAFPLRINPFEFPRGMKLSEHITALNSVFEGAFDLEPPMPYLVSAAIEKVYRDHGWYPFEVNTGEHDYPGMQELYDKVADLLDASDYAPEVKSNLKSCLQVRIGMLVTRETGNVFNIQRSTFSPEDWLKATCVIEMEALGSYVSNFLTLLLLTIIREQLKQSPGAGRKKPRHVIFLEEAHNLIGPSVASGTGNGDTKVASTKYIVEMLAEVRALEEAIVIADQLPTSLAPQVTKNTSLKIAHRITAMDDRELLASTMSADGVQLEKMAMFTRGQALCAYEDVLKPFEIQITGYCGSTDSPDNEELFRIMSGRKIYRDMMMHDCEIMEEKFAVGKEKLRRREERLSGWKKEQKKALSLKDLTAQETEVLEKNQARLEKQTGILIAEWTEFFLEYVNYYEMNRIGRSSVGRTGLKREWTEYEEILDRHETLENRERLRDKALLAISRLREKSIQ